MTNFLAPRHRDESGYLSLLTEGRSTLKHRARELQQIKRDLVLSGGLGGAIGRLWMKHEDRRQERIMMTAKEIGEQAVTDLQSLCETLGQQTDRHRVYVDDVVNGFCRSQEYPGMNESELKMVGRCEEGLEMVLRGQDHEVRRGLEVVMPLLEKVEALIRRDKWHRRALQDYRTFAKEAVLHYAVHLFVMGKLKLLTDAVDRRVKHQGYVIDNTLDMMRVREGVVLTRTHLMKITTALEKSGEVFVEAVSSLHDLEVKTQHPKALVAHNQKNYGTARYVPYGPGG